MAPRKTTTTSNGRRRATAPEVTDADLEQLVRSIEIPKLIEHEAVITVKGLSSYIAHRFGEKARKMMEDKQTGKAVKAREHRDPEKEALEAAYVIAGREDMPDGEPGKYGIPASSFKHAYLFGVAQIDDKTKFPKSRATGWFFVHDPVIIDFEAMVLRSDVGRIGQGTAQHVYRPEFQNWSAEVTVDYNTLSLEQVVALLDRGGRQGGIGEWRPSAPKNKTGSYGRFCVDGVQSR